MTKKAVSYLNNLSANPGHPVTLKDYKSLLKACMHESWMDLMQKVKVVSTSAIKKQDVDSIQAVPDILVLCTPFDNPDLLAEFVDFIDLDKCVAVVNDDRRILQNKLAHMTSICLD